VIWPGDLAKELGRLVRLGMLVEERRDDARRVYYERTDSPLWKIIQAAADVTSPGYTHVWLTGGGLTRPAARSPRR